MKKRLKKINKAKKILKEGIVKMSEKGRVTTCGDDIHNPIHYDLPIQPIDFIMKNNIPYAEGNVIKYICRWRKKNGKEDLEKAKEYIDILLRSL